MKNRYGIFESYNGLFDSVRVLAVTDNLSDAVHLVQLLKKHENENPCYSYDFKKVATDLDPLLDWMPIDDPLEFGQVLDCKNYGEYVVKKFYLKKKCKRG